MRRDGAVNVQGASLEADENRRIDQRSHGEGGSLPWLRAARRTAGA
jgi:hypothetical protein